MNVHPLHCHLQQTDRDEQTETDTETQRHRDRDRQTDTETETEIETDKRDRRERSTISKRWGVSEQARTDWKRSHDLHHEQILTFPLGCLRLPRHRPRRRACTRPQTHRCVPLTSRAAALALVAEQRARLIVCVPVRGPFPFLLLAGWLLRWPARYRRALPERSG